MGAANVAGALIASRLGARYPKPCVLSAIYALRAAAILAFLSAPANPLTVVVFSVAMGLLWLSTAPLTTALVATMFGPAAMGALYGFVFLSHQIGGFVGVWMGGRLYDLYGGYALVWRAAIGLGPFLAIAHPPVRDRALTRAAPA